MKIHLMKRTITIILLAIATCLPAMAIDKQALADTLSHFVHQRAFAENVTISNIRVKNSYVTLYTNKALSVVSLSDQEVQDLRRLVSQMIYGHHNGKVTIYTDGYEIGELVT